MILYDLSCPKDHRFESWFRNSGAVDKLIKAGEVACPACGSKKVRKAPMAPRIGKSSQQEGGAQAVAHRPDLMAAMEKAAEAFAELRKAVEHHFENVGGRFPEEARRIHYGETPRRGIYGDASREEVVELLEEGVEVCAIPWKKQRTDA